MDEPLHYVGLDASREMLRVARARGHRQLVQGDVQSLPFSLGAFDAVLARNLLKHSGNPQYAVSEMLRVTRASGFALILESCVQDEIDKTFMDMISNHLEPFQGGSLIYRDILALAERSGKVESSFPLTNGVVASPDYVMKQYGVTLDKAFRFSSLMRDAPDSVAANRRIVVEDDGLVRFDLRWIAVFVTLST